MLKNLLKYGMVILAMIASTGLLWADHYVEVVHDTVIVPCENETIVVRCADCCEIDSLVQNNIYLHNTIGTKESKEKTCWYVKVLKHFKEYGKIYITFILLLLLVVNWRSNKEEKIKKLIKWIYIVAVIAVLSESSWCYLVLMALVLLYISGNDKDLIDQIGNVIATLQGKNFKTEKATQADKEKNESEQRRSIEEELRKMQQALAEIPQSVEQPRRRKAAPQQKTFMESSGEYVQKSIDYANQSEGKIMEKLRYIYPQMERERVVVVDGMRIYLDGFVQTERENIIIEVKYVRTKINALKISGLEKLLEAKDYIQQTTRKSTSIRIIIVTSTADLKEDVEEYYSMIMKNNIHANSVYYSVYAFDELDKIRIKEPNETEDFKVFMDNVDWNELNTMEQLALYEAARGELNEKGIPFAVESIPGSDDVKVSYIGSPTTLILKKNQSKSFQKWLEDTYMDGEDGYSYLGVKAEMEKEDDEN